MQISDNLGAAGVEPGYFGRNRSDRPYMHEPVPPGDSYSPTPISLRQQRPSLTALQMVWGEGGALGYLAADFDLRDLPVTSKLYDEPDAWRQFKGDPVIRGTLFQQCRVESPMDRNLDQALSIWRNS